MSYWKPQLKKAEWNLLNRTIDRELHSGDNYLDDRTKFAYSKEKGTEVFAVYGIGDGTEATVLYASGGKTAYMDYVLREEFKEDVLYGVIRTAKAYYRRFESLWNANRKHLPGNFASEKRNPTVGTGGISEYSRGKSAGFGDDYAEGASDSRDVKTSRRPSALDDLKRDRRDQ